jgi:PRC-barrel domain
MSEPAAAPPSLGEAKAWRGFEADDAGGGSVGRVQGLFVDAEDGQPTWLVLKHGRFGSTLVTVPIRDCAAAAGRVWVAHERGTIRSSPVVDPSRPLLREHEMTIAAHYGIGASVGRAAEVANRAEGAVTSRPD